MSSTTVESRATWQASWLPWALLTIGVLSVSGSAILIRYATTAEPLAMSFWRSFAGAAALVPFAGSRLRVLKRHHLAMPALAGTLLAVHFATWITSLELTSVAAAVLLVTSAPIFVALAARWLFKERLRGWGWFGIVLTLIGTAIVAGGDLSGSSLAGNMLALIGGITASGYILAGQVARRHLGILEYAIVTYSVSAVLLLPVCLVADVSLFGFDTQTWVAIAGMVIGPQLLGHTVLNLVVKEFGATTISVAVMAEPIIATALAYLIFTEVPPVVVYPGGAAILSGIYLVSTVRKEPAEVLE